MKLFLVCMIRNEIDILPSFLGHIDSLFDSGCFVDHLSSDGSGALLRDFVSSHPGWEYHPLKTPAFVQAETSSEFLKRGFEYGADAVFFLDADEFIAGLNRAALEEAVAPLEANKIVGHLRWRNCLPAKYDGIFSLDHEAWLCGLAPHKKLVVPSWLYRRYGERLGVNQGNHSLRLPEGGAISNAVLGELLHFPIRSREQFVRKILTSYVSQAMRPNKTVAPHIQALFDMVVRRDLTPEILNAMAVNYGMPVGSDALLTHADLEKRNYALGLPDVCRNWLDFPVPAPSGGNVIDFGDMLDYPQLRKSGGD